MSTHSSLDPESFQKLSADAFVVQESGIETRSLSALVELQGWVATGELDVDRAMSLVADRARNVANNFERLAFGLGLFERFRSVRSRIVGTRPNRGGPQQLDQLPVVQTELAVRRVRPADQQTIRSAI
jgi:hypothetical protein